MACQVDGSASDVHGGVLEEHFSVLRDARIKNFPFSTQRLGLWTTAASSQYADWFAEHSESARAIARAILRTHPMNPTSSLSNRRTLRAGHIYSYQIYGFKILVRVQTV